MIFCPIRMHLEHSCTNFPHVHQPDFSWIMPGEEKTFSQYFMPYRDLGVVKNATQEALVSLDVQDGLAIIKAYTTASYPQEKVVLKSQGEILLEERFDFHPATSYEQKVVPGTRLEPASFEISVLTSDGKTLVSWQPEPGQEKGISEPAKAAKEPEVIESRSKGLKKKLK